jgi:hypothetical protein
VKYPTWYPTWYSSYKMMSRPNLVNDKVWWIKMHFPPPLSTHTCQIKVQKSGALHWRSESHSKLTTQKHSCFEDSRNMYGCESVYSIAFWFSSNYTLPIRILQGPLYTHTHISNKEDLHPILLTQVDWK